MDSLKPETRKAYEAIGVQVLLRDDDSQTDCEKAIFHLEQTVIPVAVKEKKQMIKVVILGAFGGRMDHTLQNIHLIWKKSLHHSFPDYEILMLDSYNIMMVLKPTHNIIKMSKKVEATKGCGLVPLTECTQVSTKGLLYEMGKFSPVNFTV